MKKWIAVILTIVMLSQALPWTAFAATGDMITEAELSRALQLAGLQATSTGSAGVGGLMEAAQSGGALMLEAKTSTYHEGMSPDEGWDAITLLDWLEDKMSVEIYSVANAFHQAETRLEQLATEDPVEYARLTNSDEYSPEFLELCHEMSMSVEETEEQVRLYRQRLREAVVTIEQNAEQLANASDSLFDYEKSRLSEQIREASDLISDTRTEIVFFTIAEATVIVAGQDMIDGTVDWSDDDTVVRMHQWLKDVSATADAPAQVTMEAGSITTTATRQSRLSAGGSLLAANTTQDVSVNVITENQIAIVIEGVDNQYVGGVKVRVKDTQGKAEATATTDAKFGAANIDVTDFVTNWDKEMEVSIEVDAAAQGYRSFYIPWTIIKRGGKQTHVLTLLTGAETVEPVAPPARHIDPGPIWREANSNDAKPYIYSATFNGYDITRQDKNVIVSTLIDTNFNFVVEVENPSGQSYEAPVLHYWKRDLFSLVHEEKTAKPTSSEKVSATRTKYTYTGKWKQILAPDITEDERPYFEFKTTGEKFKTTMIPTRGKVDQPAVAGTEANSPLSSVLGKGLGLNFTIPGIGGMLNVTLPFDRYLPKVAVNIDGSVSITLGSTLLDPKHPKEWKNEEAEEYDKVTKNYEHDKAQASQKSKLGTAYDYYKYMDRRNTGMSTAKFDVGFYIMGVARWQKDADDGALLFAGDLGYGFSVVFSYDYTQPGFIGPVPVYMNFNISLSAGIGFDAGFSFRYKDGFQSFKIELLRSITIDLRLSVSVMLGVGIKGMLSAWVACTGMLNIVIQLFITTPERPNVAVYFEANISAGVEVFWFKYSKTLVTFPRAIIYSNMPLGEASYGLFAAYAEDESDKIENADVVEYEPASYPALAPEAKKILTDEQNANARIKAVEMDGQTLVFYIGEATDGGKTYKRLCWVNLKTGKKGNTQEVVIKDKHDYTFDVYSDGKYVYVVACCASDFDENGIPLPNRNGYKNVYCYYLRTNLDSQGNPDFSVWSNPIMGYINLSISLLNDPILANPTIEYAETKGTDNFAIYGAFDGYKTGTERGNFDLFYAEPQGYAGKPLLYSDATVQSAAGSGYERTALRSNLRNYGTEWDGQMLMSRYPSLGFVGLSKPKDGAKGDSVLEFYDWDMNLASATVKINTSTKAAYVESTERKAIELARGDIEGFEMLHTLTTDKSNFSETIFYTQAETVGERTENRLKGIYIAPKQGGGTKNLTFDVNYYDYDLSLPSREFKAVTLGASQYLYWLATAPKESADDPDVWRINAVYYDSATGTMSDELVIAEFTLPDVKWNGKTYKSAPYEIMLTENSTGYITAKPAAEESDQGIAPLTLYSFPITLKPVLDLKGAALTEITVCQGDFVATDFALMNAGNMGIGSFDVEVYEVKNGEQGSLVETLHADCLKPENSSLKMSEDTVATGEKAFYRLGDFNYSPRQREWIVNTSGKTYSVVNGKLNKTTDTSAKANRLTTNVLVPGALGGYVGSIKIPASWQGEKTMRLSITRVSTYSNWLAAAALAEAKPALFEAGHEAALSNALEKLDVRELVYELDENSGKLVLQKQGGLFAAAEAGDESAGEALRLYATELDAPEPVDLTLMAHDIDVSHRVYYDYYGEPQIEIGISNYVTSGEALRLTCAVYIDNADDPVYVSLPYDPNELTTGKTTTIDMPLKTLVDPDAHKTARVVIRGIGVEETALSNNEFTLELLGRSALTITQQPQSVTVRDGGSASFSVTVSGGTRPYKYQWQVFVDGKWVDIPGANEATLTLEKVKYEWNGRQTRCVVTDAAGDTVTSQPATLTVTKAVDTGDHSNLPLYLVIALIAIALLVLTRRKKAH